MKLVTPGPVEDFFFKDNNNQPQEVPIEQVVAPVNNEPVEEGRPDVVNNVAGGARLTLDDV